MKTASKNLFLAAAFSILLAVGCSSNKNDDDNIAPSSDSETVSSSSVEMSSSEISSSSAAVSSSSGISSSSVVASSSSGASSSSAAASSSSRASSSSVAASSSGGSSNSVAVSSSSGGGACTPSGTTFNNVAFKGSLQMDIKLPSGSGPWPIIISSYGSAFGAGTRTVESPFNGGPTRSSGQKYATAAISYTAYSTNNPSYPKAVEDVLAAVRFLKANASTYCLDTNKVVAVGFSSGGYMTTMIAALSGVSGHKFDVGDNLNVSSKVHAAVAYAGISDIPNLDNDKAGTSSTMSHCSGSPEAGFLGCNPCENSCLSKAQEASPITYITSGNCANLPPIIMTHGDNDALLSWKQSEKMINKIKEVCPSNTAIFNKVAGGSHSGGIGESNLSGLGVSGGYLGFLDRALGY